MPPAHAIQHRARLPQRGRSGIDFEAGHHRYGTAKTGRKKLGPPNDRVATNVFSLQMPEASAVSPSKPAVALGLTFVIVGLTFAIPFNLVPQGEASLLSGRLSPEVANVY